MKPWEEYQAQTPAQKPWERFSVKKDPEAAPSEKWLPERIMEDLQTRETQAQQIMANSQAGNISKPEEIFQLTGKVGAGAVGDISGEILKSGLSVASGLDQATGGYGAAGLNRIMGAVGSLPSMGGGTLAQSIPQEVGNLSRGYQDFAQKNPRAATNIEAATNLAMVLPSAIKSGEGVISSLSNVVSKPKIPTSEAIRKTGGDLYKLAEQQGGVLKPQFMDDFINTVQSKAPQTALGKAMTGESPVAQMVDNLQAFRGQPLTLEAAKEADEILGTLAYKNIDKFGKLDDTGRQFLDMQTSLRRMIDNADQSMFQGGKQGFQTVKEARKYWAAQLRMRDVERIIDNAQYFEQPSTAIKTGFRTLLRNGDRLKGYTPKEIKMMQKAAQTGVVTGLLKVGGSGLVPVLAGVGGATATGGIGGGLAAIPAYAVQQASKAGANALQAGKAKAVSREIAKRVVSNPAPSTGQAIAELTGQLGQAGLPAGIGNLTNEQLKELMNLPPEEAKKRMGAK